MKQRIFMYLFVFAMLLIIYQYANAKRIFENQESKLENALNKVEKLEDSLVVMQEEVVSLSHFSLNRNEDAISYFENDGFKANELLPLIKDEIYSTNEIAGEHPLVPYASSEGKKMLINTVKLLNHKWGIADFSDGQYWGEIFFTYTVNKDKSVDFTLVESFLYPFY
ncbi:MAG: hydrolase [Jejuia sp.]